MKEILRQKRESFIFEFHKLQKPLRSRMIRIITN